MEKKMWARGDARAEMNRAVKGCEGALKTLHAAVKELTRLGVETGFESDAARAIIALQKRAEGATLREITLVSEKR